MILQHFDLKVSEVHMNSAMQACPGEAGLQEYMRYSVENTTQACPAPGVCGMLKHDDEELDLQEYRSIHARFMRPSPENTTQECPAPDVRMWHADAR